MLTDGDGARVDTARALRRLPELVGLGRGLTPSGDDFIAGAFLALAQWGTGPPLDRRIAETRAAVRSRLASTSAGGSSLLRVCLADFFPPYLRDVAAALSDQDYATAVRRARRHGASSGLDALAGYLWAADLV
jgi:hypothetical protein